MPDNQLPRLADCHGSPPLPTAGLTLPRRMRECGELADHLVSLLLSCDEHQHVPSRLVAVYPRCHLHTRLYVVRHGLWPDEVPPQSTHAPIRPTISMSTDCTHLLHSDQKDDTNRIELTSRTRQRPVREHSVGRGRQRWVSTYGAVRQTYLKIER